MAGNRANDVLIGSRLIRLFGPEKRGDFCAVFDLTPATISDQKPNKIVHTRQICGVVNFPLMACRGENFGAFEDGKMPGQGRRFCSKLARNLQCRQPFFSFPDQKSKYLQPGWLGKCRKGFNGIGLIHNSLLAELSNLDKMESLIYANITSVFTELYTKRARCRNFDPI